MSDYFSERDEELVSEIPNVITVENYCKWYNLYYITDDGKVKELHRMYHK